MISQELLVYYWVLVITNIISTFSFLYISIFLAKVSFELKAGARWEYPIGFLLLALSSFSTIIAMQPLDERITLAAYTATSSFALVGFLLLDGLTRLEDVFSKYIRY